MVVVVVVVVGFSSIGYGRTRSEGVYPGVLTEYQQAVLAVIQLVIPILIVLSSCIDLES